MRTVGGRIDRDAEAIREALHVLEGGQHVGVAREGPEAELLVSMDRRLRAQPGVEGIGILMDFIRIGAELDHPRLLDCSTPRLRGPSRPFRSGWSRTSYRLERDREERT